MKIEKISKLVMSACFAIIVVCFAIFFGIGYNNPVGDYNSPMMIDVVMWLMYGLFLVAAILVVWSVLRGLANSKGGSTISSTGVPSSKITTFSVILLIASHVIGYICGIGETDFTAADGTVTTGAWVTIVDMFCIAIGILFVVASVAVVVCMSGILVKSSSK